MQHLVCIILGRGRTDCCFVRSSLVWRRSLWVPWGGRGGGGEGGRVEQKSSSKPMYKDAVTLKRKPKYRR